MFGANKKAIVHTVNEAVTKTPGKLTSVEARLHLSDLYMNANGIFNLQLADARPLHSIAMHEAEENGYNSELFDAMKIYRENQVMKHFGIPWDRLIKMTHEEFTWIMELSGEATRAESVKTNQVIDDIQGDLKKKK